MYLTDIIMIKNHYTVLIFTQSDANAIAVSQAVDKKTSRAAKVSQVS